MLPVAVSLGDPSGIGPEVLRKALADPQVAGSSLLVFGDPQALAAAPGPALPAPPQLTVVPVVEPTGAAALEAATEALRVGRAAALVTGPIDKARVARVLGEGFVGQTEYVALRLGCAGREVMMLAGDRLRVALLTTHVALREVPERITQAGTLRVLRTVHAELKRWFGIPRPRLGLCALNPHAGEEGRFGDEEQRVLCPAVEQARAEGIAVEGPLPADSLFFKAVQGAWDAVIACYHDQGLAPLKLVSFHDAVNVTLGLPRLRVSPDHGVARELAGQGLAHPGSMIRALRMAVAQARLIPEPWIAPAAAGEQPQAGGAAGMA